MSRRALVLLLCVLATLVVPAAAQAGTLRAGVAQVDGTYRVGASAGQYASTRDGGYGDFDPHFQQGKNQASYGVQSRLTMRALVVQSDGGDKLALVKTDNYIAQDMLWRRAALLLEAKGIGIGRRNLTMAVTHNHSSPYYSSTAWGAWAFQDVLDVRNFDYQARQIAKAVEQADAKLAPVRISVRTGEIDDIHRHSMGPATADDGTPAGYPHSDAEHTFTVARFDRLNGRKASPLATLVNYSGHPEMLEGNDLISGDYVAATERLLDRRTGATTIFTQNAVGTSEPERSAFHDFHERREYYHRQYGQMEVASSLLADAVLGVYDAIGKQRAGDQKLVPWMTDAPVQVSDRWFPGPLSHPYPGVSNCRTDEALNGRPGVPVVGLPDCNRDLDGRELFAAAHPVFEQTPFAPGLDTDDVQALGIPIPENYSAPSYSGLQETIGIHLQAFRIGDVLFTICSCEQWKDQSRNIETRTDKTTDNEWLGYDWSDSCAPRDSLYCRRMFAQVHNDATGWNDPDYVLQAESEPSDPKLIKGNYTHDDIDDFGGRKQTAEYAQKHGYAITVPISMANDYNGYIATYREYQRGDHYRKALTAYGPHSSDYLATRLVRMGQELKGDEAARAELDGEPLNAKEIANQAHADAKATAIGEVATAAAAAYPRTIADDAGAATVVAQPQDLERFGAATVQWRGGNNYVDNPVVAVERRVGKRWEPFGDQSGEVITTLKYPAVDGAASAYTSQHEWLWTATWEAFVSQIPLVSPTGGSYRATPAGDYRFVMSGVQRKGGADVPYRLTSRTFTVSPWSGITVAAAGLVGGRPAFSIGPAGERDGLTMKESRDGQPIPVEGTVDGIDLPDSYGNALKPKLIDPTRWVVRDPARPADDTQWEWYCLECSFRPWLDRADPTSVAVTVVDARGRRRTVAAKRSGDTWVAPVTLAAGERAFVDRGGARDAWGDFNGKASDPVSG
jgi:hypothetical protein